MSISPNDDAFLRLPSVPSLSPVLRDVRSTIEASHCSFAPAAELWAGPLWNPRRAQDVNLRELWPDLVKFTRVHETAGLDAFVIAPRVKKQPKTVDDVGRQVRDILMGLSETDPSGRNSMAELLLSPGWQFSFNGVPLFVMAFSEVYPQSHVRHADRGTFLMLQPESSFDAHGIGSAHPHSTALKHKVRDNFAKHGQAYPLATIEARVEAHLYVLPLEGEAPLNWWEPDARNGQVVLF